jgi:hypothetical protein
LLIPRADLDPVKKQIFNQQQVSFSGKLYIRGMSTTPTYPRPNLEPKWFWDLDYEKIDWQASYKMVIARIIERGGSQQLEELVRFYGEDKIINALKNEIAFLPDFAIEAACRYFPVTKQEMLCYKRKQSRPAHWL